MITVKEAIEKSKQFALKIYSDSDNWGGSPFIELEEIEVEEPFWLITLSIQPIADRAENELNKTLFQTYDNEKGKKYKTFRVNGDTGEVTSMKIRTVM